MTALPTTDAKGLDPITDEFLMAQRVAGKIIERQRKRIDELETEKAQAAQIFAIFEERERVLRAEIEELRTLAGVKAPKPLNDPAFDVSITG